MSVAWFSLPTFAPKPEQKQKVGNGQQNLSRESCVKIDCCRLCRLCGGRRRGKELVLRVRGEWMVAANLGFGVEKEGKGGEFGSGERRWLVIWIGCSGGRLERAVA